MGNPSNNSAKTVRIVVALLAAACFGLGATGAGVYLAVRHIIGTTVVDYAKALGVKLAPAEVRFGPGFVQLVDATFALSEVPGVTGTVRRIDVDLSFLEPSRVLLRGIRVKAEGNPLELRDAATRYWESLQPITAAARTARPKALPKVEWQDLGIELVTGSELMPSASIADLNVATGLGPTHDETLIRTAALRIAATEVGPLELALRHQNGTLELGLGPSLLESKWRVLLREQANADYLRLTLAPQTTQELLGRFNVGSVPETMAAAKLAGHIEALREKSTGRTTGSIALNMTGWVPPYPPELKGYRFADLTSMRAEFELDPLFIALMLKGIELKTGDLALYGHGRLDRELWSLRLRAELDTLLDCVTLAKGYALDDVGGNLGQWAARNAAKAVSGSVAVKVQIDADSRQLNAAKVVKRIGIGCGLRPMSLSELLNLGLPPIPDPKTIEQLVKKIPQASALVNVPSLLPSLQDLNPFTAEGTSPHKPQRPGNVNQASVANKPSATTKPATPGKPTTLGKPAAAAKPKSPAAAKR